MKTLRVSLRAVLAFLAVNFGTVASAQDAEGLSARFREAARAAQPAVVSVEGTVAAAPVVPPTRIRVPGVDIAVPGFRGAPAVGVQNGSGIVVDAEKGLVLTADHVVEGSGGLVVTLPDGEKRPVASVVHDPESDLALLTIAPGGLAQAKWGDSEALDLGDWVLTVGSPFGLTGSISAGIVSGKGRAIHERRFEDLIQTDANVYPGSSGGPLVNLKGEVVGVVVALQGERERGPSFAIPASRARRVAGDLATVGHVRRAYLGVRLTDSGAEDRPGVFISAVEAGSPAAKAGLMAGDVLRKVGGRAVSGAGEVRSAVEFAEVGKPLSVTVGRGDEVLTMEVVPGGQPANMVVPQPDFIQPGELDLEPDYRPVPRQ